MYELIQDTASAVELLMTDGAGGLVTGIASKPTVYYMKAGGSLAALNSTYFDWAEIDATNAPGLYRLTINATGVAANVLDTPGRFLLSIKASGGSYIQQYVSANVAAYYLWDYLLRIRGWQQLNHRVFPTAWDSASGNITVATMRIYPTSADAIANTNHIEEATIAATYNASGQITGYRVTV